MSEPAISLTDAQWLTTRVVEVVDGHVVWARTPAIGEAFQRRLDRDGAAAVYADFCAPSSGKT